MRDLTVNDGEGTTMSNTEPQGGSLLEILVDAWGLDPKYASPEWQQYAAQHFRPDVDLDELEAAQKQYREVLTMLAWRLRDLTPAQSRAWVSALRDMALELEKSFGVNMLAVSPTISDQRRLPQ